VAIESNDADVATIVLGAAPLHTDGAAGRGRCRRTDAAFDLGYGKRLLGECRVTLLHDVDDAIVAGLGRHPHLQRAALVHQRGFHRPARIAVESNNADVVTVMLRAAPLHADGVAGRGHIRRTDAGLRLRHFEWLFSQSPIAMLHHIHDAVIARIGWHPHL